MKAISVSEFKATCLKLFENLEATGESFEITKRGRKIAIVCPANENNKQLKSSRLGFMKGKVQILGDIVSNIPLEDQGWEVLE